MGLVMASPVKNKNGVWSTRLVVPKELRPIIGKSELKRSLGTKLEREARLAHPAVLAEFQAQVERARRQLESNSRLTDAVIDSIVFNWKKTIATQFSTNPSTVNPYLLSHKGLVEENNLAVLQVLDDIHTLNLREQELARTDSPLSASVKNKRLLKYFTQLESALGEMFRADLSSYQVEPDVTSPQYQKLLMSFAQAYIKLTHSALKKFASDADLITHGAPKPSAINHVDVSGIVFTDVWEEYQQSVRRREPDKAEQRLRDYSSAVNKFIKMYPDYAVTRFSKGDIAKFRNILEQLPSRPKKEIASLSLEEQIAKVKELDLKVTAQASVKKQLQAISAVFSYAVQQDYIQTNPVHGASSDIKTANNGVIDKHYSDEEISRIFTSKLFTDNYGPEKADYGQAPYWLPLMLYYTGARAEELAQLYVADVNLEAEIPYIQITDEREDQSIKTGKRRQVPIHSHLLELGFDDYVNSLSEEGRLFPSLSKPKNGKYHVKVSLWFGKFISSELGIQREGLRPYHAFRHTFITGCRQRNVRLDTQNAITGHTQSDIGSRYGAYPLPMMNEVIQAIPRCF